MEVRELICINCPLGCPLTVRLDGEEIQVSGNTCKRGEAYAREEVLSPTRIVTSTMPVDGGAVAMVSVKTQAAIPKDRIFKCMEEIRKMTVAAPVKIGDVLIADCAGTGTAVVATKCVKRR